MFLLTGETEIKADAPRKAPCGAPKGESIGTISILKRWELDFRLSRNYCSSAMYWGNDLEKS
jgi:hypothetical protein